MIIRNKIPCKVVKHMVELKEKGLHDKQIANKICQEYNYLESELLEEDIRKLMVDYKTGLHTSRYHIGGVNSLPKGDTYDGPGEVFPSTKVGGWTMIASMEPDRSCQITSVIDFTYKSSTLDSVGS